MVRSLQLFFLGVIFFFGFIFFSYLVHEDIFTKFDFDTTVRLQDNIGQNWDREFSGFSELGRFEIMLLLLITFFVFTRQWISGGIAFVFFGCFHVIELFGKYMVNHPPPPHFLLRSENLVDFPQFHVQAGYSYPSGHSGRAAFLSIILLVFIWQTRLPLWLKILFSAGVVGYDISMFISRVTLGEHWASDVIGGAILGAGLGMLVGSFMLWYKKGK